MRMHGIITHHGVYAYKYPPHLSLLRSCSPLLSILSSCALFTSAMCHVIIQFAQAANQAV
uniref:Uncharacterized protein n=1 Tax=Triticum urartu TaxID=4572 RepID=A0A8R7NZE1_TRIUA